LTFADTTVCETSWTKTKLECFVAKENVAELLLKFKKGPVYYDDAEIESLRNAVGAMSDEDVVLFEFNGRMYVGLVNRSKNLILFFKVSK
jgi:hypothetical protein